MTSHNGTSGMRITYPSGARRDMVRHVALYVAGRIMSTKLLNQLTIDIEWLDPQSEDCGVCQAYESGWNPGRIRSFTIGLKPDMSDALLAETIAHEMRHVEQYARRKLRETPNGALWKFTLGRAKHFVDTDETYMSLPWEVEAFATEPLGIEALQNMPQ